MLSYNQIEDAATRLATYLKPTPILRNALLDQIAGQTVLLKAESLNITGSFKIRGALNRMLCIPTAARPAGVVAMSSGNHAQAVAQAAQWLSLRATIVMPSDAPRVKRENTHRLGATVVLYDRANEDREAIAQAIAANSGATIVHPYDDPLTMAGQGTAGLELAAYAKENQLSVGCVAAPCSGGGLIAGVGTATRHHFAQAKIFAVEPRGYEDHYLSLQAGKRIRLAQQPQTLCDALQAPMPGATTFATNQHQLTGALSITDAQAQQAMRFAAQELKLLLEPSGAAALAALLAQKLPNQEGPIGLILSGGNADPNTLTAALSSPTDSRTQT